MQINRILTGVRKNNSEILLISTRPFLVKKEIEDIEVTILVDKLIYVNCYVIFK
jgi:hypothetical protein